MKKFSKDNLNSTEALTELMHGSGVVVIENVFDLIIIQKMYLFW